MSRTNQRSMADVARRQSVELPGRGRFVVWDRPGPSGAPTLVLLHGATLNTELNWSGVIETLAERHRVVAFDMRGHGEGVRSSRFALEDCADDVAAVSDALGLGTIVPVGYSMGGFVAQLLWRQHPDLVSGMVLCCTSRNVCGTPWERTAAMMLPGAAAAIGWSPTFYPLGADLIGSGLLDHDVDAADRTWALAQMRRTTLLDALAAAQAGYRFTSHDWISTVDVPTASVITMRDQVVPPRRQYRLATALPDNTVIEIDADHGAFLSAPGRFGSALLAACDVVTGTTERFDEEPLTTAS